MLKIILLFIITFLPIKVDANETLLTVQQQLERLQREVSDLSKSVFANPQNNSSNNSDVVTNLSAIDMRIYDLEKDVKNLTGNLEEIFFQIDDMVNKIKNMESSLLLLNENLNSFKNNNTKNLDVSNNISDQKKNETNTLGELKISSQTDLNVEKDEANNLETLNQQKKISPEDQFQSAFDNIREKNWEEAKKLFKKFIDDNPENQLAGSAHYWLGELYILENKHRDAALIFAEGYQNFPKSIKAPDMLFKLSQSLYEVEKNDDACKTLEKLMNDFPNHKLISKSKKQIIAFNCNQIDG